MKSVIVLILFAASAGSSLAGNLIERDGRYEVNWTTGKVRFYGVGKISQGDENYRSAEQRAWADGLKAAEIDIPKVMTARLGAAERAPVDKILKLSGLTTSVNTTYFGDERVKVVLEAPVQKLVAQLTGETSTAATISSMGDPVVIKLPRGTKPSVFVKIIDEGGKELVSINHLVRSVQAGSPMAKWFKSKVDAQDGFDPANSSIISAHSPERGTIRVQSSDWKESYAAALVRGSAAFMIE